jgi:hypothetical protein
MRQPLHHSRRTGLRYLSEALRVRCCEARYKLCAALAVCIHDAVEHLQRDS